ncbi:MAG: ABC transporter permease [Eubacterium sp.]|nr:ABC transporter permease [Eubacterium sp.]
MKYEMKKVFSKRSSQIALLLILALLGVVSYLAVNITYVDGDGNKIKGPAAAVKLKEAQKEWAGCLDEEKLRQAIAENRRIKQSAQYRSKELKDNEIAYSWGQGVQGIRDLLNCAFAKGFQDYDYYRADSLTESDAADFYSNRIQLLKSWLSKEASEQFSDSQKAYLVSQYEKLQVPFSIDYMLGWRQAVEYAPTVVMLLALILGYLVAGIFSGEFSWRADAVFFSSAYGRNRAVRDKIKAGLGIVTGIYAAVFILYTCFVLLCLGADGAGLPVQASWTSWKSFYHMTVWQEYLAIAIGGYLGCLFLALLTMLVSAKTKSAVLAVMVPFLAIFLPTFLQGVNHPAVTKVTGLLPDQLLQVGMVVRYFHLYEIGGKVVGALPILLVLYLVLAAVLVPVIDRGYRKL